MKKLFLLLLVLPLAFFACGDDDDNNGKDPKDPDKMTIEEYMKEDRPFKWNGDWNDPDHPKYKPEYATKKYNPLVGVWHTEIATRQVVIIFTEDYHYELYDYDPQTKRLKFRDRLPMKAVNDRFCEILGYGYDAYGLNSAGNILYMNHLTTNPSEGYIIKKDEWGTWEKLDESDYILPDK